MLGVRQCHKMLEDYFESAFTKERDTEDNEICVGNTNMLRWFEVTKSIEIDKSPGPDGIYFRLLREAREEIARSLYLLQPQAKSW